MPEIENDQSEVIGMGRPAMHAHKTRGATVIVIVACVVLLAAGRLYLPYWVKDYVNTQIAALDGYVGAVEDVHIHLWRGAYTVHGLNIYKEKGGLQEPFVAADTIDFSVEWRALLKGAVVAEIDIYQAVLNFSRGQSGEGADWAGLVDAWSPFDINRLALHGGKVSYIDYTTEPNVNLYIDDIEAHATNLRNVERHDNTLPSDLKITGQSIGGGSLKIEGKMNIIRSIPDFDIDAELTDASLSSFNDYTSAFAAVEFESGTVGIFSELAAAAGKIKGYIKIVATDVSVDLQADNQNPLNALWKTLVSAFMDIFKNHPRDQFAFRIPIEGELDDPDQDKWSAFLSIFDNAFGQAFTKDTDGNIRLEDVLDD